jgi:uncharacterized protein (DUF58 family)
MKPFFLTQRVYKGLVGIITLLVLSAVFSSLYYVSLVIFIIFVLILIYDGYTVKHLAMNVEGSRNVDEKLSLGDDQHIAYILLNKNDTRVEIEVIDELPEQMQQRDKIATLILEKNANRKLVHQIKPLLRGIYQFGSLYGFISTTNFSLVKYKKHLSADKSIKVYPSIIQMKKFALQIFSQTASFYGIRKVRTIGENDEFEHIRNYVVGDNMKAINWKATSRKGELLVNQYQDSRSQMVYSILDKGRAMEMPFEGLALLDYAINSCLVISNIVLQKYDKAGLITFSNTIDSMTKAEANLNQLEIISQALYSQQTAFKEPNFELLYFTIRKSISKRSILFLYTNFEDKYDLERNLHYLKLINRQHLLIVISFINSEIENTAYQEAADHSGIYIKTIAQSTIVEKEIIMKEIKNAGIQVILTKPEDLSIMVINKYLEIKAKRMK